MSKYINLEKIAFHPMPWCDTTKFVAYLEELDEMPGEDVAPVIYAHWVDTEGKPVPFSKKARNPAIPVDMCWCSNCKALLNPCLESVALVTGRYCPNCGARMNEDDMPMEYFENGGI